jgi:hypothetical protein
MRDAGRVALKRHVFNDRCTLRTLNHNLSRRIPPVPCFIHGPFSKMNALLKLIHGPLNKMNAFLKLIHGPLNKMNAFLRLIHGPLNKMNAFLRLIHRLFNKMNALLTLIHGPFSEMNASLKLIHRLFSKMNAFLKLTHRLFSKDTLLGRSRVQDRPPPLTAPSLLAEPWALATRSTIQQAPGTFAPCR